MELRDINGNVLKNKKVKFKKTLDGDFSMEDPFCKAKDWDTIIHIGKDESYGDVFKAYDIGFEGNFSILFGTLKDKKKKDE